MSGSIGAGEQLACAAAQRYSPRPLTQGELWTVRALWRLRRGRYRAPAWRSFLLSSLERSANTRSARPALARQARAWCALGAGAWVALCQLSRDREVRPNAPAGLLWWCAVWRMLDWHLGMAEGGDGAPRERLGPADAVTLARFWLAPIVVAARRSPNGLPGLIVLAGLTDWGDGALARRRGRTRLGRDLDSTADLAFGVASLASAHAARRVTTIATCALAARHAAGVAIAAGAVFGRCRRPAIRARPWGAALRVGGLAACTAGKYGAGTAAALAGALVPPRSTAAWLSAA
jgi:phosphatidylglycerophosphate synthase